MLYHMKEAERVQLIHQNNELSRAQLTAMMLSRFTRWALIGSLSLISLTFISGCSGTNKPESIATQDQVNKMVELRKLFTKVGGDWNKLSDSDKAEFVKFAGDEKKAQFMWFRMGHPGSTGGPDGSGPSSAGPG